MMDICEVRDECTGGTYPVVMEYFVNKNLDETHRDLSEHEKESNLYAVKMAIEECPDVRDDNKKEKHQIKKQEINEQIYYQKGKIN